MNNNYIYDINKNSHVAENIESQNYPIVLFDRTIDQGTYIGQARIVGSDMNISGENWYARSSLFNYDFNALSIVSEGHQSAYLSSGTKEHYENNINKRINDLHFSTDEEREKAEEVFEKGVERFSQEPSIAARDAAYEVIVQNYPEYENLSPSEKYNLVSKIHL
ncbi:MAG: hypothetical protein MJ219_02455 [Mycoplasmoidaceae bacterium]|nr:hypothetical protein [Mycoplasmoidaceae bacterium]